MIDLRALEAFVWSAQLGKFSLAARKLNLTQPAISTRISALEGDLGVVLFERGTRHVVTTAKGKELLAYAERMLELRAAMRMAANEKASVRGSIRMGVADTLVYTWFPRLIERIQERFPQLTLAMQVDTKPNLIEGLQNRELDIAFVIEPVPDPGLRKRQLVSYSLDWVASTKLALPRQSLALSTVSRWPVITYLGPGRPFDMVEDMLARENLGNVRFYTSSSMSTMVTMIRRGLGVGVIPAAVVAQDLRERRLRILSVKSIRLPNLEFVAAWSDGPEQSIPAAIAELAAGVARP